MALMNHVQSLLVDIIYHLLNPALIHLEILDLFCKYSASRTRKNFKKSLDAVESRWGMVKIL